MTVCLDVARLLGDCAARGWNGTALAKRAGVAQMTASRALRGLPVEISTAKKLAKALRQDIDRYLVAEPAGAGAR
jgi:transcriptional regulator with XRE-family HTH domain